MDEVGGDAHDDDGAGPLQHAAAKLQRAGDGAGEHGGMLESTEYTGCIHGWKGE